MSVLPPQGPPSVHEGRPSGDSGRSSSRDSNAMNVDDPLHDSTSSLAISLDPHRDARALIRTIQCFCCSLPLRQPVTLPCGKSICQQCMPPVFVRENVTYPANPERRTGLRCPFAECGQVHTVEDVNVTVVLQNLLETIHAQVEKHLTQVGDKKTTMEEFVNVDSASSDFQHPPSSEKGHSTTLPGARLVATYKFAESGQLHYLSDVIYHDDEVQTVEDKALANTFHADLTATCVPQLECQVCYGLMLDPVTTPCGHTFCRKCLARILDHSSLCAICRRDLPLPPSLSRQASSKVLCTIIESFWSDLITQRREAIAMEEQGEPGGLDMPIFVCATCYPGMPFMLHVFEPRYRLMIRRALATNGQFGMAAYNSHEEPQGALGNTQFMETGTVLQIESYQLLADGRSYLMCRGNSRFKILAHGMMDGYIVARTQPLEDVSLAEEEQIEAEETQRTSEDSASSTHSHPSQQPAISELQPDSNSLADNTEGTPQTNTTNAEPASMTSIPINRMSTSQLFERCQNFIRTAQEQSAPFLTSRITQAHGEPPDDPATFPYWFARVVPLSESEKYKLLPTTSVRERLKITAAWVEKIESQRWYVHLLQQMCLLSHAPPEPRIVL